MLLDDLLGKIYLFLKIQETHKDIILWTIPWVLIWTGLMVYIAIKLGRKE